MATNVAMIIDDDGHVVEDMDVITSLMPRRYRDKYDARPFDPFPPLDHLHSCNLHDLPPGAFARVGPEGWLDFLKDVGIEATVLYTDRKSTRLNSSHIQKSRMPSSA